MVFWIVFVGNAVFRCHVEQSDAFQEVKHSFSLSSYNLSVLHLHYPALDGLIQLLILLHKTLVPCLRASYTPSMYSIHSSYYKNPVPESRFPLHSFLSGFQLSEANWVWAEYMMKGYVTAQSLTAHFQTLGYLYRGTIRFCKEMEV